MIYVGIDIAKDKHDCYITNEDGEVLYSAFTIYNSRTGFDVLYDRIMSVATEKSNVRIGLEATGHYSYNLLGYLTDKGLETYVINPLHTSFYRKSRSLRRTKTDSIDACTIATMLMSDLDLKSYSDALIRTDELKSLTRYRFDMVRERAKLKTSVSRLVTILFPELESLVPSIHIASMYALLIQYPGAEPISNVHITTLTSLLVEASRGHYGRDMASAIRTAARCSIGTYMPAKALELRNTLLLVQEMDAGIDAIEYEIKQIMDKIDAPMLTIPGINYGMGAMIYAEIGDFNRFPSADKLLAYAGLSPSTYQSGKVDTPYSHMEKRGSKYLRYALFNATKYVCRWDPNFSAYLHKKMDEGKHYNIAISHTAKKLVRVIYHLETTGEKYDRDYAILRGK
ncbi:MAG: IS110 family transposase [Lachnospiraceae bacterium]|nr:IS110 family transposase [Lachnospiraceae bacterium]